MAKPKKGKVAHPPVRKKKRLYQVMLAVAVIVAVASIFILGGRDSSSESEAGSVGSNPADLRSSNPALRNRLILPAWPQKPRPLTLSPAVFTNPEVQQAYQAAKEVPEVLETVPCYCGCYGSSGHRNNLDCYKDNHGDT